MVRVNHPPGGSLALDEQEKPDAKTVRVLKPPGGESSIAFSEDDEVYTRKSTPKQESKETNPASQSSTNPSTPSGNTTTNGNAQKEIPKDVSTSGEVNGPSKASETSGTDAMSDVSKETNSEPSTPVTAITPKARLDSDTKSRLFGDDSPCSASSGRKVRDRMKSSIFEPEVEKPKANGSTPNGLAVTDGSNSSATTPEVTSQRQRIPPGGFSTKLW